MKKETLLNLTLVLFFVASVAGIWSGLTSKPPPLPEAATEWKPYWAAMAQAVDRQTGEPLGYKAVSKDHFETYEACVKKLIEMGPVKATPPDKDYPHGVAFFMWCTEFRSPDQET